MPEIENQEISRDTLLAEIESLRQRAEVAEETLAAISRGEVDALVVAHPSGQKIFTLSDADHAYRVFVEEMSEGAVTVSDDGSVLFCNKKFAAMTGFPQEMISGRNLSVFFSEHDRPLLESALKPCSRDGVKAEMSLKTGSEKPLPVILSVHCIQLDGINARACIVTDISEKQAQLDESEERFRIALENIPAFCKIYDDRRRILFVNSAWLRVLDKTKEQVIDARDEDMLPARTVKEYLPTLLKTFETASPQNCEYHFRLDGRQYQLFIEFVPIMDGAGKLKNVLALGYDISEFKRNENDLKREKMIFEKLVMKRTEELINAKLELEKNERLADIGQLASTVAHELRNPLAAIHLAGMNIMRKTQEPSLRCHLSTIQKKVAESDQIINNLLFYSRLKKPNFSPLKLIEIIVECVEAARMRYADLSLEIKLETDAVRDTIIEGDGVQLKEVFSNILNNAAEAIPPSVKGEILVSASGNTKKIEVRCRDNGIGMASEVREQVFNPFFTTKSKGTGLGLSVCRQIISLHKGSIRIDSTERQGTTVVVHLPVHQSK